MLASTEQSCIWLDSKKCDHPFYHLIVIHLQGSVDSARVQSAIHHLTQQFPILVNQFLDQQNQVLQYEATDYSDLVQQVTINEALLGEPDQLCSLVHNIHCLNSMDHPLFTVVELVSNGCDHIEWLSVYCHYVLGDQIKFHYWVEKLQYLINDPSDLKGPILNAPDSGDGLDPTKFWKTHFPDGSLGLDLTGQQPQPTKCSCLANWYEPTIPGSLVTHLFWLMESLSMSHLELLQGFMALFLLRVVQQSHVVLFGQVNYSLWVPWVAQAVDEMSVEDSLHSLTEQYHQSTQYDWLQFHFPKGSGEPNIH
ncbi:hypothetical protein IWQ61_010554, partial [Dispira simplex]